MTQQGFLGTSLATVLVCYSSLVTHHSSLARAADWPTWHGGPARTGNADGKPGPKTGNVLWVFQPKGEQFIGSPSAADGRVYIGGVGLAGTLRCLGADGKPVWELPNAKVPGLDAASLMLQGIVSAPAVAGNLIVLGEGLHQNEKTRLRGINAADGTVLWVLPVDSHLEGGPTLTGGKVFTGAGAQGVLCLDAGVTIITGKGVEEVIKGNKDYKPDPAYKSILDKELPADQASAAWAKEFKRQWDIANKAGDPPDDLPRPEPKKIWQYGAKRLHVDAAVTVSGERVFAGSAYIDEEKVGLRAVTALSAKTGEKIWEVPTNYNPWGPPSIAGDLVISGCSSIRFDAQKVGEAKGEVIAFNAGTGAVAWKATPGGGVLSAVAVVGDVGYHSCTDGKLYALDLKKGAVLWTYDCKAPVFATPAVADGVAYVADLKGVVHAVDLKSHNAIWTLNLASKKVGGQAFGSPIVSGGRLYVSLMGDTGGVVCIGD